MSRKYRDEEWLRKKYTEEGLTQEEIADIAGCGQHTISRWLRKFDIKTRDRHDYTVHPYIAVGDKGYLIARCQAGDTDDRFYIHRLVGVAKYGFDAVSDADIHHKNGFKIDNRWSNIEVKDSGDHMREHRLNEDRDRDDQGRFC